MAKSKRKTRVTKIEIRKLQEEAKVKAKTKGKKNKIIPGPWTDIDPKFTVKASLRWGKNVNQKPMRGTYRAEEIWGEKSWYPIIINITSKDIRAKVKKHGLEKYLAACEKSLNSSKANIKDHGHIVLMEACVDNSQRKDDSRFISCRGKTNKKSITGFAALRSKDGKKRYTIIE